MIVSHFYPFQTSLNLGVQRNSYFDSSDSDCSVSDDEGDGKIEEKIKRGKILKAGFLRKKVKLETRKLVKHLNHMK